ncbi:TetR/AcrR family transcriptional regulator [Clostridium ganghwense]|uniref:TetR/AcrR family transcriptional regulator n=1 Tax=Clostridium ganghwense TaxID=312089 RepID=A0ABT4CJK0_9CLOT|nr:TetR/AcrR family transcriptional regulator [Clostridium ganghwense]MCY6369235.1 TetR/AcrR family transcriptional regulator [Clostridium ganghwense]
MPKIIKNIEQNIFNAAFDLFGEHGYREVDMKMIAKKVGIAVGTLYNYYPNKKQLFIDVFKKSWESTFYRINNIMEEEVNAKEKIRNFIYVLYEEISGRKGLGKELIKDNVFGENAIEMFSNVKKNLLIEIEQLLKKIREEEGLRIENEMENRLGETIFILIIEMITEHPKEKEKNIKFITQVIECTYGNNK